MATLREYYDTSFNTCMKCNNTWELRDAAGKILTAIQVSVLYHFESNAKYWSIYCEETPDALELARFLFENQNISNCTLGPDGDGVIVQSGFGEYSERGSSSNLVFTKLIYLFINQNISIELRSAIKMYGLQNGFHVITYDKEYAAMRSLYEKPLAFISHDSRDKDVIVRELVLELSRMMCPVWYDEFSLKVGDSLRSSIETGLKETKKCVVILSPNFLSNEGWSKAEFDSIYTREIIEKNNVILPIWHNVDVQAVYNYSPRLADKVGLNSQMGIKELATRLAAAIKVN